MAGLRPAPAEATSTSTSKAGIPWEGGTVWVGRTRRKPFHGGSMAPSMAPTVLPTHAAPPLTDCRDRVDPPCVDESPSKSKISISDRRASTHGVDLRVDQGRHLPTAAGICRRRGTVGLRGVSRMDAAAKPPWTGSRRPRKPTVPRQPTGTQLLLLRLPASGRHYRFGGCRAQPCRPTQPQPSPWMPPGACVGSRQRRTVRWKNRLFGNCSTVPSWPSPVSCSVV